MFNFSQLGDIVGKTQALKKQLESIEETGSAGGGGVSVTMNGGGLCTNVTIQPSLLKEQDHQLLEDLISTAVNHAQEKVRERNAEETSKVFGNMPLPFDISKLLG